MAGRAKSQLEKNYRNRRKHDELMQRAVKAYQDRQAGPKKDRIGLRKICMEYQTAHYQETGEIIKLCHMTLKRLADGGRTRRDANAERAWLTQSEENIVVEFLNEMAARGFPYSHRRTKEIVDMIARARLGTEFPETGVGMNWTHRFTKRHADRIKVSRSRPLEDKRARAANPTNNTLWFTILGNAIEEFTIKDINEYGVDEVGVQTQGQGERELVLGPRTKAVPYQQRSGTRENITVIATICADGTSLPPAVIFKGGAFQVKWGENNPLNATYDFLFFSESYI